VLVTLSISVREAILLFGLFWAQFIIGAIVPESAAGIERVAVAGAYIVLGLIIFARERHRIVPLLRDGLRTPYAELSSADRAEAAGE
jgi:cation:H+ antiporter